MLNRMGRMHRINKRIKYIFSIKIYTDHFIMAGILYKNHHMKLLYHVHHSCSVKNCFQATVENYV
jgi:hypothetical protein